MRNTNKTRVFYGINWIVEKSASTEREMKYLKRKGEEVRLAEIMRKKTRGLEKHILDGSAGDMKFSLHNEFIMATAPRPYNQWIYECAKSDIVVLGSLAEKNICAIQFEKEKRRALLEKDKAWRYIEKVRPALEKLHLMHLMDGVIGRGSYFDKNGYPKPKDDIDFVILRRKDWNKEQTNLILDVFRKLKTIHVSFVMRSDRKVNSVRSRVSASFVIGSEEKAKMSGGIPYERYVLATGIGIPISGVTRKESERLARELMKSLPKKDMRKEHRSPRLPPNSLFADRSKKL